MSFIPELVRGAVYYFKVDPRGAARIVAQALGWLVIAGAVIDKAIEVLKQVLLGLA